MFRMEGVELEIRELALRAIARKALARKTGARGLRSILEQVLLDVMYDLPSLSNLARVVVDESTITNDGKPLLMFADHAEGRGCRQVTQSAVARRFIRPRQSSRPLPDRRNSPAARLFPIFGLSSTACGALFADDCLLHRRQGYSAVPCQLDSAVPWPHFDR